MIASSPARNIALIRARQKIGKYRVERRLAESPFATVFQAYDTIEGIHVALKIPRGNFSSEQVLDDFRREVRLAAKLDHPNILPLKNAAFIDGIFVIVSPLGEETLADRLCRRMSLRNAFDMAGQILEAVAYAHEQRIIHCDLKPENVILFAGGRARLADFGIAKVALRTLRASGSGTVGYIAPEQAMGRPSFKSDVFSLGLILCRMFTGTLPEWPYRWPPEGLSRRRRRMHPELVEFLRKSTEVDARRRYVDAQQMLSAFRRLRVKALKFAAAEAAKRSSGTDRKTPGTNRRRAAS